ncbi:hypothetical protein [Burkholderia diffusa]|uniref:hypothetical protein n=1 Tax=Burkholderia diffusa TaxID=488732 RepID=UPI002ABDD2FA|nr:hypothetical protein [Burkholderia diffusa]
MMQVILLAREQSKRSLIRLTQCHRGTDALTARDQTGLLPGFSCGIFRHPVRHDLVQSGTANHFLQSLLLDELLDRDALAELVYAWAVRRQSWGLDTVCRVARRRDPVVRPGRGTGIDVSAARTSPVV